MPPIRSGEPDLPDVTVEDVRLAPEAQNFFEIRVQVPVGASLQDVFGSDRRLVLRELLDPAAKSVIGASLSPCDVIKGRPPGCRGPGG